VIWFDRIFERSSGIFTTTTKDTYYTIFLEEENKTGAMTETDICDVGGIVMVDKILENAEKTIYIFNTRERGFVEVGDQEWDNVAGNITMTSDNNGIMTIETGTN
jgi:hypothetical protein